jgi:fructose-1,6-bisphosphatase/inositol monophosphatase family enzyme
MLDYLNAVSDLLKIAGATSIMPVFRSLEANPREKTPGEWVSTADNATEEYLTSELLSLLPGSVVIGEEAASSDSTVIEKLIQEENVWLVDPLDGTANFAAGVEPFACMVALIKNGETVASWIFDPVTKRLVVAEKGSGTWINGDRIHVDRNGLELSQMYGSVLRRFLSSDFQKHIAEVECEFAQLSVGSKCAGFDYPDICVGDSHFAMYWRTLPWDHAPGVLILEEAGGIAQRLNGDRYLPRDSHRNGLLAARNVDIWNSSRERLVPKNL